MIVISVKIKKKEILAKTYNFPAASVLRNYCKVILAYNDDITCTLKKSKLNINKQTHMYTPNPNPIMD